MPLLEATTFAASLTVPHPLPVNVFETVHVSPRERGGRGDREKARARLQRARVCTCRQGGSRRGGVVKKQILLGVLFLLLDRTQCIGCNLEHEPREMKR